MEHISKLSLDNGGLDMRRKLLKPTRAPLCQNRWTVVRLPELTGPR